MKVLPKSPPRKFRVGRDGAVEIFDCGSICLEPDQQVTFTTPDGGAYDVARKDWGFYATPSLEGRLPDHGLRPVLARNAAGRSYVLLVEHGHETAFQAYLEQEGMTVVRWLDSDPDPGP